VCSDENVNRILKYIYNNQDFNVIKKEINEQNVSAFYSQAYVMRCENLIKNLESMIVKEILKASNSTEFYLDAISFNSKIIALACEELIQQSFSEIIKSEEGTKFLLGIPFSYMRSICCSNKLNIADEKDLIGLFEKYLAFRDNLPLLKEEDPS
jgi:hypothetical protein